MMNISKILIVFLCFSSFGNVSKADTELFNLSLQELMNVNVGKKNESRLYLSESNPPSKDTINIALIVPLTYERAQSVEVVAAARTAASELNKQGGIDGKRVSIIVADDNFDKENLASLVEKMKFRYQIKAIIGPFTSKQSVDLFGAIENLNIPMILPAANADAISHLDDNDWVFRLPVNNSQLAKSIGGFLHNNQLDKLAIFYQKDIFGEELESAVSREVQNNKGQVLLSYPVRRLVNYQTMNLRTEFKKLKDEGVQAIFLPLIYNQADSFIGKVSEYWDEDIPTIILAEKTSSLEAPESITRGKALCVYATLPLLSKREVSVLKVLDGTLETKSASYSAAYVYDTTYVLFFALKYQLENAVPLNAAIRHVTALEGPALSANDWKSHSFSEKYYQFEGQSGAINFDKAGDNTQVKIEMETLHHVYGGKCEEN